MSHFHPLPSYPLQSDPEADQLVTTQLRRLNDVRQAAMADGNLDWLMNWYVRECDNDWEHSYGVKIATLDNPEWTIEIDLNETSLEGRTFDSRHGEPAGDLNEWRELGSWWTAEVDGVRFKAACGPTDLSSVIGVFKLWVESHGSYVR